MSAANPPFLSLDAIELTDGGVSVQIVFRGATIFCKTVDSWQDFSAVASKISACARDLDRKKFDPNGPFGDLDKTSICKPSISNAKGGA